MSTKIILFTSWSNVKLTFFFSKVFQACKFKSYVLRNKTTERKPPKDEPTEIQEQYNTGGSAVTWYKSL